MRPRVTPEEARAVWENELEPEEFYRQVAACLADAEDMRERRALITWFKRRYPTAKDRLAYARRMHAQCTRSGARE